ncbi:MAG: phage holin family protein [Deltaproteobacteria bacterium]|jgi:putative membrane protein|nr:phage holin family protein [Deltaproteobacteria bacterium]MBW2481998.1 phage holin family protein [Deltaproteobacteria bacterium]
MNGIFVRWLTLTVAIVFTSYLLDGIHISGFFSALLAAAMLGILNAFFRPIALVLTLPINVLSLGFFTFVINALMLKMASAVITGFDVTGFWTAVFGSLLISVISWLLSSFINDRGTVTAFDVEYRARHKPNQPVDKNTIDLEHKGDDRWE